MTERRDRGDRRSIGSAVQPKSRVGTLKRDTRIGTVKYWRAFVCYTGPPQILLIVLSSGGSHLMQPGISRMPAGYDQR